MATQSNIDVKILAEFLGKSAFKQADTATKQLTSSVKKLSGAIGLSFGVYGIKSMGQAFLQDAKAAQVLATNLKNVGLGFNTAGAEAFIKVMQDQTGILDDELRPAYAQLARVTGSVEKTQQMLALAFDTAAGTGNNFSSVVDALSQAYVGNTKGLKALNTGLTTAELSTMTYAEIADRLSKQFNGSGQASLEGYAGQFALLNVKIADAKEALGKSFIDLLAAFSGEQGVGGAASSIEKLTGTFAKAIEGVSLLVKEVKIAGPILVAAGTAVFAAWSPWLAGIAAATLAIGAIGNAMKKTSQTPMNTGPLWFPSSDSSISKKIAAEKAAAEKAAAKRAAELAALTKKNLKAQQDTLKITKAKAIFDLQKIQIEAALKGKISEEDRIRLKLMQAIEDENITQIEKYTKLLNDAQTSTEKLVSTLANIKPLDDIFKNWNFMSVQEKLATLQTYFNNFAGSAASAFNNLGSAQKAALGGYVPFVGATNASLGITSTGGNTTFMPSTVGLGTNGTGNQLPAGVTINTTVQGSVITENDLNQAINNALAASGWAGSAIGYSRQAAITAI